MEQADTGIALSAEERRAELDALRAAENTKTRHRGRDAFERALRFQDEGRLDDACRWLERAHRLAPADHAVAFSLALLRLQRGDVASSAALLLPIARRFDLRQAWTALAIARRTQKLVHDAAHMLEEALSRHVLDRSDPSLLPLATALAHETGAVGWCGVGDDAHLLVRLIDPSLRVEVEIDGSPVAPASITGHGIERRVDISRTHAGARRATVSAYAASGHARQGGLKLLAHRLDLEAMRALDGCVAADGAGGLIGWAWHPRDPGRVPALDVVDHDGNTILRLAPSRQTPVEIPEPSLGMTPYGFKVPASALPPSEIRIVDPSGRDLPGSPLDPGLERRSIAVLATLAVGETSPEPIAFVPVPASFVGPGPGTGPGPARARGRRRGIAIVVPVYRDEARTLECLDSVEATVRPEVEIHVVDDATPEPALAEALTRRAAEGRIVLHRWADGRNRGFPSAANAGMEAAGGRDVVLLNADTRVAGDWLDRLAAAAYAAPGIGTATPFTNEGSIVGYPRPRHPNEMPGPADTARLAALASLANDGAIADLPTANGFCMYIRRDCLDDVGDLREDLFAQGYGEENDFCLRARHRGWRHVAALDTYVAHAGGTSFKAGRAHLIQRNLALLNRLHPGYDALIAAHIAEDPLAPARRRLDAARFAESGAQSGDQGSVVIVTHQSGGGVERVVRARIRAAREAGLRAIVLRGDPDLVRDNLLFIEDGAHRARFPNLRFTLPDEAEAVRALLAGARVRRVEIHHLLSHHPSIGALCRSLGPIEIWLHDYAWFCRRIALLGPGGVYCGEPPVAGCRSCIEIQGSLIPDALSVDAHLAASSELLGSAARIVAPTADAARRLEAHFPGIAAEIQPWEPPVPPTVPARPDPAARRGEVVVCVLGAIGPQKGIEVLIACARDAAARRLGMRFVVVGHTSDDERVLEAGNVFVTGPYDEDEAGMLIRLHACDVALLPSVWPETWCYTLSECWRAGLEVVAFDLGAQAERIAEAGRGVTLPLEASPGAVNDALLGLARGRIEPRLHEPSGIAARAARRAPRSLAHEGFTTHHPP